MPDMDDKTIIPERQGLNRAHQVRAAPTDLGMQQAVDPADLDEVSRYNESQSQTGKTGKNRWDNAR